MLGLGKIKDYTLDIKTVNNIRSLAIDMIKEAGSGHSGVVLSAAPIIYTLYSKFLKVNPEDDKWINRDRFVLSNGHASALLYATLFMAGYDLTIEDLKNFRKKDSLTPAHPEYLKTPGVETTTGPLGQGISNAVGMAIAEKYLSNLYKDTNMIDYNIYCMCGDGDLMEGISYEATSLAGTLKLDNLILLYDANKVCLDSKIDVTFNDDIVKRFESISWNVEISDDSVESIEKAITKAKENDKPTLVIVNTTLGKYSKLEGTPLAHGAILDDEDILNIKEKLDVRYAPFSVSEDAVNYFREQINNNIEIYNEWNNKYNELDDNTKKEFELIKDLKSCITLKNVGFDLPIEEEANRDSSSKILNGISNEYKLWLGGSADLSSSNKTYLKDGGVFSKDNYLGKNIFFGVREHAMGGIANGIALSGLKVFVSTFLSFSDYMKPAIRMSALMDLPVIYIFTHDSITVGEDGPTHQPVEQLISLRSIPNIEVFRPYDANETIGTYKAILQKESGPSVIVLSRNKVKQLPYTSVNEVEKGAYILKKEKRKLDAIIVTSGEEVGLCTEVSERLIDLNIDLRVVSMPSIERFKSMPKKYQEEILPKNIKVIAIERSSKYSWDQFTDKIISIDNFGISASLDDINKNTKFTTEDLIEKIKEII